MLLHRLSRSLLLLVAVGSYFAVVAGFTAQPRLAVTNHPPLQSSRQMAALTSASSASSPKPRVERRLGVLSERRWNFNDGQAPWGMKKNAETWNGRIAQELIQGKGVIQGFRDGDFVNVAGVGAFAISVVGLTAFLALKGSDDYTKKDVEGL